MDAFKKEKRSWLISLILGVIYLLTFFAVARKDENGENNSPLLFGFCVWGYERYPNKHDGCDYSPINSHNIAFAIDVIMAIIGVFLYMKDQTKEKTKLAYIASIGIILIHGALHAFLSSDIINCYKEVGERLEEIGYIVFAIFSFVLCLIIQGLGFGLSSTVYIFSGIFTAVVVTITRTIGGGEFILTGLFCIVHPLSSIVGLFSDNPSFSKTVGWWFVVATTVGILELTTCEQFFQSIGGHFFYDLTLHTAVLYSLPYFNGTISNKKDA